MAITESAARRIGIALVAVGAGAAGAALGKLIGYVVATAAGSYLIGGSSGPVSPPANGGEW